MSDADEAFAPFPCRSADEVDYAVFRGDPVDLGPRVRDRRARCQRRDDARFIAAGLLVVERRPQSDDALAATGAVSAVGEVQLAAAAAQNTNENGAAALLQAGEGLVDEDRFQLLRSLFSDTAYTTLSGCAMRIAGAESGVNSLTGICVGITGQYLMKTI